MVAGMQAAVLSAHWRARAGYTPTPWEKRTGRAKYGSRVWHTPHVELREVPVPKIGPQHVLIRAKACGVCGSDVHMYERDQGGYMLYPGLIRLPVILGHELSGQVVEVGKEVSSLKPGDMVACEEMWWCGVCDPCRMGYLNQCVNLEEMGFTVDGGDAEYVAIPHKYCWKISELIGVYGSEEKAYEAGSLVEPTSVSYNALFIRAGGVRPGSYVVVYGAGPIGLAAIALAKAAGAAKVVCFDVSSHRLQLARVMGADHSFNPIDLSKKGTSPHEKVLDLTGGQGVDMNVEAAGAPEKTLPEMEESLAIGGKIAVIGRADAVAPIFLERFQVQAAQVYGSQGHSGSGIFPYVIRMMAAGKIDMTRIITKRYPLSRYNEAIKQGARRVDAKITVKP